jgi:hypothetical protein
VIKACGAHPIYNDAPRFFDFKRGAMPANGIGGLLPAQVQTA